MAFIHPWGFGLGAIRSLSTSGRGATTGWCPTLTARGWRATSRPRSRTLFDDEGHLSLGITRFGDILDALVASGR